VLTSPEVTPSSSVEVLSTMSSLLSDFLSKFRSLKQDEAAKANATSRVQRCQKATVFHTYKEEVKSIKPFGIDS